MVVAILDAGAQYGKVIDRRCRELKVESHILPMDTPAQELERYDALIISGGPQSVYGAEAPAYDEDIFSLEKPVLGICYGMQLINHVNGGGVRAKRIREDGPVEIGVSGRSRLFSDLPDVQTVLMSHGDSIDSLAYGFSVTATSGGIIAAIENEQKKMYGVQFHPEVDLTEYGVDILRNFLFGAAGLVGDYSMEDREAKAIDYIRSRVGSDSVLVLVSGGVDSSVCATLLNKALDASQIYALHIDNGLMRLDESAKVKKALGSVGLNLHVVDASFDFYNGRTMIDGSESGKLSDEIRPERKRKIIGDTFMKVAEKEISRLGLDPEKTYLAQGTLRPDLIESASKLASGNAATIKTHHNDTELVRKLRDAGRVIEPLQDYHKDEVRELGRSLGLAEELVGRQPFPGPGLGVRILCAEESYITPAFDEINERLKSYVPDGIFATLLPVATVGVQGDGRTYSYLCGLSGEKNWEKLFSIAAEIPKRIHEINRLVYIFGKPVEGPIREITQTFLRPDAISQLQQADDIVNQEVRDFDLGWLSQVPVVLAPLPFGVEGNRSIGIRTFITNDFMTGRPAVLGKDIPQEAIDVMVERILSEVSGISRVMYDLTSKPPGTTEWE